MKHLFSILKASRIAKFLVWIPITALVLVTGILYGQYSYQRTDVNASGLLIEQDTVNIPEATALPTSTGIKIPGYAMIEVEHSTGNAQIDLINPADNPCVFQYSLTYASDNKEIYQSQLIEPGKAVCGFTLDQVPDIGVYDIIIQISTYSLDESRTSMNGAQIKAVLNVV
jgi:hypothetical protein